jgi:hypothetical protein
MKNCPHETLPVADHRSWIKVAQHLSSLLFHCARNICLLLMAVITLLYAAPGLAVTLYNGDYSYLPDDTTLGVLYLHHTRGRDLYSRGEKISDDAKLSTDVQLLRFVRYEDWGDDYGLVPQVVIPIGYAKTGGILADQDVTNGVGDVFFVLPMHFLKDPTGREAKSISVWLWAPTGDYDNNNELNPFAENRWKLALQAGRQWKLTDRISTEFVADVQFHGDNDEFGSNNATLEQQPLWEFQGHARYYFNPKTFIGVMTSHIRGGATRVDGIRLDDSQNLTKAKLSVGHMLTPKLQIIGSIGQDIKVRNGVKEDLSLNLRILKFF